MIGTIGRMRSTMLFVNARPSAEACGTGAGVDGCGR